MDESLIDAIRASVEANPENLPLRVHFLSLLHQGKRYRETLESATYILSLYPAHLEALNYAYLSAEALGEGARAEGYRQLYNALRGTPALDGGAGTLTSIHQSSLHVDADRLTEKTSIVPPLPVQRDDFDTPHIDVERSSITLADVAGMEEVKRRLRVAFLEPMRNPELRKLYGRSLKGGLLMYGPPGCGKTYIARAVAGELGAHFLSIGLSDVLDMYIGNSEKNLHRVFEMAREQSPCVLFFDEADALGRKRSQMRGAGANVINQLLAELDGIDSINDGIFILAATNHPWDIDGALRRPGRLDRTLLVLPPDSGARSTLLKLYLRDRPVQGIDVDALVERTEGFSGADLVHLVDSAAEFAMEDSILSGKIRSITRQDFTKALREVKASTRGWFDTAKNHALFANDGGIYNDLLDHLRLKRWI